MTVNKDNAMTATRFEHVSNKNGDGTPVRCKRNGKTKTWKTRDGLFQIPVKYGLRGYFYIDNFDLNNAGDWNVVQ
jgi:hypothetical protein